MVILITSGTIIFILFLFWLEFKKKPDGVSRGILIPLIWIFFASSRYLSQWLNLGSYTPTLEVYVEGSPLDRMVFLILIVFGLIILARRKISWNLLFKKNIFIFLYFIFGLISVIWSDYTGVSLKRIIKSSGNVIMALIILTEERPDEAVGAVMKSLAFILLPLSVLFIKYYPHIGRAYHMGMPLFQGVATHKNSLGKICLITGIYFVWNILYHKMNGVINFKRINIFGLLTILPIAAWLLHKADSATSLMCLFIAIFILAVCRLPFIVRNPVKVISSSIVIILVILVFEMIFGLSKIIIVKLGRDPSLTTRVPMWMDLISMTKNPIIGAGYESFWLGGRLETLWGRWGKLNQAHNGYLETYLNLGFTGLSLLVLSIVSGFLKIRKNLLKYYPMAILKLAIIAVVVIYNWTEASFHGINSMWLLLFFSIIDFSKQKTDVIIDNKTGKKFHNDEK